MGETKAEYDIKAAQAAIEADRKRRAQACGEAMKALLDQYNCRLEPYVTISGAGVEPGMRIVAN